MSREQSRDYYDTFADIYEAERHHGYHLWLDQRSVAMVKERARDQRVLEVGCGTGLLLKETAPVASQAVGLDLSHGMLRAAADRSLTVVEASADSLPFDDAVFDLVYSFKVLAHVPDIARAVAEMVRVTRPGGRLVLEFYNRSSLRYLIRRLRPDGKVGPGTTEGDVFTRFDALSDLQRLLPDNASLVGIEGLRVATVMPQVFRVPVLGKAWTALEDALSASPLRRFAGFLVLVIERS